MTRTNKILSLLLAVLVVVSIMPMGVLSVGAIEAPAATLAAVGNTYTINNINDWVTFSAMSKTQTFEGKTIELAADLDFGGREATNAAFAAYDTAHGTNYFPTPARYGIGDDLSNGKGGRMPFMGTFDGKNHTIKNYSAHAVYFNGNPDYSEYANDPTVDDGIYASALFINLTDGVIKNLNIMDSTVHMETAGWNGFLVSRAVGNCEISNITMRNCRLYSNGACNGGASGYLVTVATDGRLDVSNVQVYNSSAHGANTNFNNDLGFIGRLRNNEIVTIDNLGLYNFKLTGGCDSSILVAKINTFGEKSLTVTNSKFYSASVEGNSGNVADGINGKYIAESTGYECTVNVVAPDIRTIDANGFTHSLSLNGEIAINIYPVALGIASGITFVDPEMNETTVATVDGKAILRLSAKDYDKVYTAKFFLGTPDAPNYISECTYKVSVKGYAEDLALVGSAIEKELAEQINAYGAAAKAYFKGETVVVATADYTDVADTSVSGEYTGVEYKGTTLMLKSNMALRCYFAVDQSVNAEDIEVYINSANTPITLTADESEGWYYIQMADIAAKNLGDEITIKVTNSDESESLTIKTSVLAYCKKAFELNEKADLVNLVNTVANYNKAAKAFLAADMFDYDEDELPIANY